jgi:hypothetical protein
MDRNTKYPLRPVSQSAALAMLAIGMSLASVAPALADTAVVQKVTRETGRPVRIEAASIQMTATVENVDYKARTITLRSNDGKVATVDVGPEVKRLDEVRKGDQLEVEYVESIAVAVQQPGAPAESVDSAYSVLVRNPTQSPSGRLIDTATVSATVESVDLDKRIVELRRADGSVVRIPVSPEVRRLAEVKKGDTVAVQYTRQVALSIRKPESR